MSGPVTHVSRLVPPGPTVRAPDGTPAEDATLTMRVEGDPEALGRLLAAVEPLRADVSATIVTDADAEVVRFLAVLAVLEERAAMPDYDLDDPSLKWHARKGVKAVPNAPTIVTGPAASAAPGGRRMSAGTVVLPAAQHTFTLEPGRPVVMGIINTNPGSFSDTVHLASLDAQMERAMTFVAEGAGIIDVGTDSGVTYGESVPLDQQVAAAVPLVEALVAEGVPVSIDTPYAVVARATLEAGACMINDVSGLADLEIARLCAAHDASLVILHTRVGHKQEAFLDFPDITADIEDLFEERTAMAVAEGLTRDRIVLDPGLGYSKHPADDVRLLRDYDTFIARGLAILTGASRKLYSGVITGAPPTDRLPETIATVAAVRRAPGFVRVHDVGAVRAYLDAAAALDEASARR